MKTDINDVSDVVAEESTLPPAPEGDGNPSPQESAGSPGLALVGYEADEEKARELVGSIDLVEPKIAALQKELVSSRSSSLLKALKAGEIFCSLQEALKKERGHGAWQAYVEQVIGCSVKKAGMYMRFHKRRKELEKSATFPNLGIKEADEMLKPRKEGGSRNKPGESSDNDAADVLKLADDKPFPLEKVGWEEGIISSADLSELIRGVAPGKNRPRSKVGAAREQQMIVTIAASVNRACGSGDLRQASLYACSALETLQKFLSNKETATVA